MRVFLFFFFLSPLLLSIYIYICFLCSLFLLIFSFFFLLLLLFIFSVHRSESSSGSRIRDDLPRLKKLQDLGKELTMTNVEHREIKVLININSFFFFFFWKLSRYPRRIILGPFSRRSGYLFLSCTSDSTETFHGVLKTSGLKEIRV